MSPNVFTPFAKVFASVHLLLNLYCCTFVDKYYYLYECNVYSN